MNNTESVILRNFRRNQPLARDVEHESPAALCDVELSTLDEYLRVCKPSQNRKSDCSRNLWPARRIGDFLSQLLGDEVGQGSPPVASR